MLILPGRAHHFHRRDAGQRKTQVEEILKSFQIPQLSDLQCTNG